MALVLDATPGGPASNSYSSREAADAYLAGRMNTAAWTSAGQADQERALVAATARLDQESYDGSPAAPSVQRLKWPRYGLTDDDGMFVDSTTIPRALQDACAEQALSLLQDPSGADMSVLLQFERVQVGPISVTPRATVLTGGRLAPAVVRLLAHWRQTTEGQFRISRG